jgi:hypothetical protein
MNSSGGGLWFGTYDLLQLVDKAHLENWPAVQSRLVQTGGMFCQQKPLFGVEFEISADDPLAELGNSYSGSNIAGVCSNEENQTSGEQIEQLCRQLVTIGLQIDQTRSKHFAEAYLPISAFSAWQYALGRNFKLVVPRAKQGTELCDRLELGLDTLESLKQYLQDARQSLAPEITDWQLMAVAVFENSD